MIVAFAQRSLRLVVAISLLGVLLSQPGALSAADPSETALKDPVETDCNSLNPGYGCPGGGVTHVDAPCELGWHTGNPHCADGSPSSAVQTPVDSDAEHPAGAGSGEATDESPTDEAPAAVTSPPAGETAVYEDVSVAATTPGLFDRADAVDETSGATGSSDASDPGTGPLGPPETAVAPPAEGEVPNPVPATERPTSRPDTPIPAIAGFGGIDDPDAQDRLVVVASMITLALLGFGRVSTRKWYRG